MYLREGFREFRKRRFFFLGVGRSAIKPIDSPMLNQRRRRYGARKKRKRCMGTYRNSENAGKVYPSSLDLLM